MKKMNSAIIGFSETSLTVEIENSEVNVSGYSIIRCDAENKSTEGAVLYVRDSIKCEILLVNKIILNCNNIKSINGNKSEGASRKIIY